LYLNAVTAEVTDDESANRGSVGRTGQYKPVPGKAVVAVQDNRRAIAVRSKAVVGRRINYDRISDRQAGTNVDRMDASSINVKDDRIETGVIVGIDNCLTQRTCT